MSAKSRSLPDGTSSTSFTTAATLTSGAVRNLGDLKGGDVAGIGFDADGDLIMAGTTSTDQLSAGTATNSFGGSRDAFVAKLAGDLGAAGTDRLTFFGGDGEDSASAVSIAGGKA